MQQPGYVGPPPPGMGDQFGGQAMAPPHLPPGKHIQKSVEQS